MTKRDEDGIEALFGAARGAERPDGALVGRVLADAEAVQAGLRATGSPAGRARDGWLNRVVWALGGWPGVSGVVAAGVAGIAIGIGATDRIDTALGGQVADWLGGQAALVAGIDALTLPGLLPEVDQ